MVALLLLLLYRCFRLAPYYREKYIPIATLERLIHFYFFPRPILGFNKSSIGRAIGNTLAISIEYSYKFFSFQFTTGISVSITLYASKRHNASEELKHTIFAEKMNRNFLINDLLQFVSKI